jgi:hypothetical protein
MTKQTIPSGLPDWLTEHLTRYVESDGADGHLWDATSFGGRDQTPTLLLTTKGRKSGQPRLLPLIYGETQGGYVIIASKGGASSHPAWYLNLLDDPIVDVQIESRRFCGISWLKSIRPIRNTRSGLTAKFR